MEETSEPCWVVWTFWISKPKTQKWRIKLGLSEVAKLPFKNATAFTHSNKSLWVTEGM